MSKLRRFFVGLGVHDRSSQNDNWCPSANTKALFAFTNAELAGKCLAAALSRTDWASGFSQVASLGYTPIRSVSTGDDGSFDDLVGPCDLWAAVIYPPALASTLARPGFSMQPRPPVSFRREPTVFLGDHRNVRFGIGELRQTHQVPYVDIKEAAEWTFAMSALANAL